MLLCDCYFIHTMLSLRGGCIKDLMQKEWEKELSFIPSPGTSTWITVKKGTYQKRELICVLWGNFGELCAISFTDSYKSVSQTHWICLGSGCMFIRFKDCMKMQFPESWLFVHSVHNNNS